MKTKKIKLEKLKVDSFTTSEQVQHIYGGRKVKLYMNSNIAKACSGTGPVKYKKI